MKCNGYFLRFGVAVEKEGMDYFSDSSEFVKIADDLNEKELECVIESVNEILDDIIKYKERRIDMHFEDCVSK